MYLWTPSGCTVTLGTAACLSWKTLGPPQAVADVSANPPRDEVFSNTAHLHSQALFGDQTLAMLDVFVAGVALEGQECQLSPAPWSW
mmetsp:Transcript_49695/g.118407  ORF Transcript_49695/g.118407 Transcript_49695/m.118407 type:complete len:87 (-) Transcript_49695:46-306(-)